MYTIHTCLYTPGLRAVKKFLENKGSNSSLWKDIPSILFYISPGMEMNIREAPRDRSLVADSGLERGVR